MKKGLILVLALALAMPLALQAQPGPGGQGGLRDGSFCGDGPRMMGGQCDMHGGHRGPGMRGDGPGIGRLLAMADEIGLTDEQVDKLKTFQTEFRMEQIDTKAELEKAQVRLHQLMMDDDVSEMDVNRAIDQLSSLRGDMQKLRYSHHKQMKAVLTDEQQEKLQALRKERRQNRCDFGKQGKAGQGRGSRSGGGPGGW